MIYTTIAPYNISIFLSIVCRNMAIKAVLSTKMISAIWRLSILRLAFSFFLLNTLNHWEVYMIISTMSMYFVSVTMIEIIVILLLFDSVPW